MGRLIVRVGLLMVVGVMMGDVVVGETGQRGLVVVCTLLLGMVVKTQLGG